jgi:hypothetical protein
VYSKSITERRGRVSKIHEYVVSNSSNEEELGRDRRMGVAIGTSEVSSSELGTVAFASVSGTSSKISATIGSSFVKVIDSTPSNSGILGISEVQNDRLAVGINISDADTSTEGAPSPPMTESILFSKSTADSKATEQCHGPVKTSRSSSGMESRVMLLSTNGIRGAREE